MSSDGFVLFVYDFVIFSLIDDYDDVFGGLK